MLVGKSSLDSRVVRGVVMNIHTHMCDTARSLQGELSNVVVSERFLARVLYGHLTGRVFHSSCQKYLDYDICS